MRGRWMMVVAVASLVLNVMVVGSFLFLRFRRPPRPPFHRMGPGLRQRADCIYAESRPEAERLMRENERLRAMLAEEILRKDSDERRLDSLSNEVGRIHGQMTALAYRNARRVVSLLPEPERRRFVEDLQRPGPGLGPRWRRHRFNCPPGPPPDDGN